MDVTDSICLNNTSNSSIYDSDSPSTSTNSIKSSNNNSNSNNHINYSNLIPIDDLPFHKICNITEPSCLDQNNVPFLFNAWIVNLTNPLQTRHLIKFAIHHRLEDRKCERTRHLRRVRKAFPHENVNLGPNKNSSYVPGLDYNISVLLAEATPELTKERIMDMLRKTDGSVSDLEPYILPVPARRALTNEEYEICQKFWPVSFTPKSQFNNGFSYDYWDKTKLEWVMDGLMKARDLALEAKCNGELPIAAHVSAPPPHIPVPPGYPPPTPNMKALGNDTRISTGNPLNHAIFNCVRQVGRIRHKADYDVLMRNGKRLSSPIVQNGAEYLCTSLTMFSTHEPCMMCAMALVHSRVRDVYFLHKSSSCGGCGSIYGVHEMPGLNHHFEAWYLTQDYHNLRNGLEINDDINP